MNKLDIIKGIKGGLIVSCQALENEPLYGSDVMARMALAACIGGAVGIRANTGVDIMAIKESVHLPIIGILKRVYDNSEVYITPTIVEVDEIIGSGAEIIATDATGRPRPGGISLKTLFHYIRNNSNLLIMADVSNLEEGLTACEMGADIISTTLSGYTSYSKGSEGPDYKLIENLAARVNIPVIAEGRIGTPEQAKKCFDHGAYAIVVGGAITRPQFITKSFVQAING